MNRDAARDGRAKHLGCGGINPIPSPRHVARYYMLRGYRRGVIDLAMPVELASVSIQETDVLRIRPGIVREFVLA
jgi:hypothetical protein